MHKHVVLLIGARFLLPAIFIFALYVQMHGEYGAGGGFQAGVIFAAGFILYALVFGLRRSSLFLPLWMLRIGMALGVLLYAGTGMVSLFFNKSFLDYHVLHAQPQTAQHIGIFLVECGVGLTVASVMLALFYAFAGAPRPEMDEER